MTNIIEKITENYKKLSDSEKQVIDYVLGFKNKKELKIKIIEESLYISSSTIIRACKKIGYDSFNQFKFALINSEYEEVLKNNKTIDIFKNNIKKDFEKTLSLITDEKLEQIISEIKRAKRIFCIGIGMSSQVCIEFNRQLKLLGFWANDYIEKYAIQTIPDIIDQNDLIVDFSLSGEDSEINKMLLNTKMKGARIAGICSLSNNSLANLSDTLITVYNTRIERKRIRSRLMLHLAATLIIEKLIMSI